ncbi:GNAT family N-acetyltransferase [Streptomyces sp. NPDC003362]
MESTERTMDADPFDPTSNEHVDILTSMYADYLVEEQERTGHMVPGFPVAGFLRTAIIRINGQPAGFFSADLKRYSIELIYVKPEFRGQGVATLALAHLAHACPQRMDLKAPLSPGGEALAKHLNLGIAESTPEQIQENKDAIRQAEQAMKQQCRHKRTGDPRRPCKRCYRTGLRKYAHVVVSGYSEGARALMKQQRRVPLT